MYARGNSLAYICFTEDRRKVRDSDEKYFICSFGMCTIY